MSVRTAHAALTAWLDAHPDVEPISASLSRWDPPQVHLTEADWGDLYPHGSARHVGGGLAEFGFTDGGCRVICLVRVPSADDCAELEAEAVRHRDATIRGVRASR